MINWGDFWQMPDYRQFQQPNKNRSIVAELGRTLDPMTHIPGIKEIANPIHDAAQWGADTGNRLLSPVVGAANQVTDFITPGLKQLRRAVPMLENVHQFVQNKPVDAAAIAAATYFSGGAAAKAFAPAMGGAGAGGTGTAAAPLGAANTAAASNAITPTAFTQGAGAFTTQAAAPASYGALGATGTQAGMAMLTPKLSTGLLGTLKPIVSKLATGKQYFDNLSSFANAQPNMGDPMQQANMQLAERIRNDQMNPEIDPRRAQRQRMATAMLRGRYL